jgi:peptidyl-prolyl cis-trans isomerase C
MMNAPLLPKVTVNGVEISAAAIANEAQNHPAPPGKPGLAWRAAARALALREVLLQEARARGLQPNAREIVPGQVETADEALIRALLESGITPDEPDLDSLQATWRDHPDRFRAPDLWEAAHILLAAAPEDEPARAAALTLANELAAKLAREPGRFAELAARHSACSSRKSGGLLGQIGPRRHRPRIRGRPAGLAAGPDHRRAGRLALWPASDPPRCPCARRGAALRGGAAAPARRRRQGRLGARRQGFRRGADGQGRGQRPERHAGARMKLGTVSLPGRGATDACLAAAGEAMQRRGLRLAGTVQTNLARTKTHPCDMDLQVLPDGPVFHISQELGRAARGCRLNGGVLETAVVEAQRRLPGAQVLIVNKFGKLESEGRGFVPVIVEALGLGLPVLVGVNGLNLAAFESFAEGLAEALPADPGLIADWVQAVVADRVG